MASEQELQRRGAVDRRPLEEATRRALDLGWADQYRLLETLRANLEADLKRETAESKQLRERQAALEAIRVVAAHLRLAPSEAPSPRQFDDASKELGLGWSSSRVVRSFEFWNLAIKAFKGERLPPTAAQRTLRRSRVGTKLGVEGGLEAVRAWLATSPTRRRMCDFEDWANEHNAHLEEGEIQMPRVSAVRSSLNVGWTNIIAVAEGAMTLEAARDKTEERLGQDSALVGRTAIARLLGCAVGNVRSNIEKETFPKAVAKLGNQRVWFRHDVEAWRDGLPVAARTEFELQSWYVDCHELQRMLGVTKDQIHGASSRKKWISIPEPDGAAAVGALYWERAKVEKWKAEREI